MKKSIFYYKQLTATEVGKTGTHEIYIRMPNDFDYKEFFQADINEDVDSVVEKRFEATNLTKGHENDNPTSLRFVYFKNSNKEKRIPSLGELFRENDVKENDVVRLESRIVDDNISFYITFLHPDEVQVNPKSFCYSILHASVPMSRQGIKKTIVLSHQQTSLSALRTKPFMLLAGISGTGKSRSVRKWAQATVTKELQKKYDPEYKGTNFEDERWSLHKPANFELIQVKPNWHNSMDVVGYLSNIPEPHYVFTPFIHFVVKAWQNPDVPFFLCLDEMNLAPVEEYFAEFLSAIESRSRENGEYETDPIIKPFNEFGDKVCDSMLDALFPHFKASEATGGAKTELVKRLRDKGLTLPKNLIVVGTVNMDETTFSFSRKVLDRAMSIEMNEVDYDKFISGATDDDIKSLCSQIGRDDLNKLLVDRHIEASELVGELDEEDVTFVIGYLKSINCLFDGTPFKLGYRASNEALIYLAAAKDFGNQSNSAAMDDFTLMKILSRIEGDESKLKLTDSPFDRKRLTDAGVNRDEAEKHGSLTLLTALREIIKDRLGEYQPETKSEGQPAASTEAQPEEPETENNTETQPAAVPTPLRSIHKIDSMISQLERDRFVSYWN